MKITDGQFKYFTSRCNYYLNKLGLISWEVYYKHEPLIDNRAEVGCDFNNRIAVISLNTEWDEAWTSLNVKKALNKTALHECLEIMLSPLVTISASREFNLCELKKETHTIIRVLEKRLITIGGK